MKSLRNPSHTGYNPDATNCDSDNLYVVVKIEA
jgi:hypothetical protein